jgi:energy-coupling factor transport system permease protein
VPNLEFFRNVSIGQYFPGSSYAHRLTPATKYLWLFALAIPGAAAGPLGILLVLALSLAVGAIAGLKAGFLLRGVKPALPFFLLAALLQFLFGFPSDKSAVLFSIGPFSATANEARGLAVAIARTVALLSTMGLFTSLASEGEIAHGVEDFLAPLSRLGFPAHKLALVVASTFRFIPVVAGELEAIVKAQAVRGADFGTGRGGPIAKARAYLPLIVPVTVRALEKAELLSEAMEARAYTGEGRSRYVVYEKEPGEWLARLLAILVLAAGFALGALDGPAAAALAKAADALVAALAALFR